MAPDERELAEEMLAEEAGSQGGDADNEPADLPNWYRAFTLLRSVGHTIEDILEMSPQEFEGFLREAQRFHNERHALEHTSRWLTSKAASLLSAPFPGEDHSSRVEDAVEQVITLHKSFRPGKS